MKIKDIIFWVMALFLLIFSIVMTVVGLVLVDVASDTNLVNITAENNFTHLEISNEDPYNNLVLYLPFDSNASSSVAYDYFGKYNGTIINAYHNESGKYGGCMIFDGTGDYLTVGNSTDFNFTSENFTISMWILHSDSSIDVLFWKGKQSSRGYYLEVRDDDKLRFSTNQGGATQYTKSTDTITVGEWTHIGVTRNGTTVKLYKNGVETSYDAQGTHTDPLSSPNITRIGSYGTSTSYDWHGGIDEVMVFNTSLNSSQMLDIFNNQSARFEKAGIQEFINQSELNTSTGYDNVRVTGTEQSSVGSIINLSVGYFNGSWHHTSSQVFDGDNSFTINNQATNLTLNFTFHSDSNQFYSPILLNNLTFTLSDTINPSITLITPYENSEDTDGTVIFAYLVEDGRTVSNCSIYLDSLLSQTDTSITKSIQQTFTIKNIKVSDSLKWYIECRDNSNNLGTSSTRHLDTKIGGSGLGGGGFLGGNTSEETPENQTIISIFDNITECSLGFNSNFFEFSAPFPEIFLGNIGCDAINILKFFVRLEDKGSIYLNGIKVYFIVIILAIIFILQFSRTNSYLNKQIRKFKSRELFQ